MKAFNFDEEEIKKLLVISIKIGCLSPEMIKTPKMIEDVVNGMLKEIKKEQNVNEKTI